MSTFLNYIFTFAALILTGVSAAFLVVLNKANDEQKKKENEDGKINKQNIL